MDRLRSDLDLNGSMEAMDQFSQRAFEIIAGERRRRRLMCQKNPEGS
jgi:hypothetical protein